MSLSTGTPRRPYSQASQFGVSSLHEHFAEQRKQGKCDTYILFSNRHELPVRVCWVAASDPRSGAVTSEREFFTLEPGCERVMWTWCGHVWLLRSVNKEDADTSAHSDILCETTAAAKPTVCRVPEAAFLRILKENKGNSFVKFVNEHGGPVRILWRDRRGEEKQYAELASGQEYVQYTWVGHEWVVRDRPSAKNDEQERRRDDGILVELTAGPEPLTVVIPPRNPFLKCNSTASLQDEELSDVRSETGSLADVRSVVSSPKSAAAAPSCPIEGYAPIALRHLEKSPELDHVFDVYCDPVAGGKKHDPFDHVRGSLVENLLLDLHEVKKILHASQTFRKMLQIVEEENQYYNSCNKINEDESDLRLQEGDVVESRALLLRSNFERFGRIFVNETYTYPEGKNNGKSCAKGVCCHWAGGWLLSNGNDPGKAGCVEVYQRQNYLGWRKEQPAILFHELSHAFHWQCQQNFGKLCSKKEDRDWFLFLDAAIKNTYEKVKATGKYEKVKYIYGQYQRHYALTTPNEYFAELCEAFCSNKRFRNDYYPFIHKELRDFDPDGYALVIKVWGFPLDVATGGFLRGSGDPDVLGKVFDENVWPPDYDPENGKYLGAGGG